MLVTRTEILAQNQRDSRAFEAFTFAMREMLMSEMESFHLRQNSRNRGVESEAFAPQLESGSHITR